MPFGQVVIGPPGSGKTTYCNGMNQFLTSQKRKIALVNLDPANDCLPYEADIDMSELITLDNVMEELDLGPNGGLVYCMKFLEENFQWLEKRLSEYEGYYFLFDLPGQVELYTHEECVHNILQKLQKIQFRLTVVHLVDAHYCTDSAKFISVVLLSLSSMARLEMPHINVLSKVDLIEQYGKLAYNLDFYTEVMDLNYLLAHMEGSEVSYSDDITSDDSSLKNVRKKKFQRLNELIIEVIEDYQLVNFFPLNIQDGQNMLTVSQAIDNANGYVYPKDGGLFDTAASSSGYQNEQAKVAQEKYVEEISVEEEMNRLILENQ